MGTVLVTQTGNPWVIAATGGSATLPVTLCNYDLIPKRIRWEPDVNTKAGDAVIIQNGQSQQVYKEVAASAFFEPVEQKPDAKEVWWAAGGGVKVTQLDSGQLEIHY